MDTSSIRLKFMDFLKKYKYAAIIVLVGIVLMLTPLERREKEVYQAPAQQVDSALPTDQMLEEILSHIAGAGEVQVLLTVASGEETLYQTDIKQSQTEENSNSQIDTVTITDQDRNEQGLIRQIISPIYRGAIIVCQGADSANVRLAIVDAVSKVTGLNSDRISVLKMK